MVRRATIDDAAGIAEVHAHTWRAAYGPVFGAERLAAVTPEARLPGWRRVLAGTEQTAFVAERDGRVIGWCTVAPSRDRVERGELRGIYVLPEDWGTGAGPSLERAGVGWLREAGFREAVLWVLAENPRARRFYEREGWSPDGEERWGEHLGVTTLEVRYRRSLG